MINFYTSLFMRQYKFLVEIHMHEDYLGPT